MPPLRSIRNLQAKMSIPYTYIHLLVILRMFNTRQIALLNPLQRQRRDQRSTNTRSVFSWQDLNRILLLLALLLRPIQDLT